MGEFAISKLTMFEATEINGAMEVKPAKVENGAEVNAVAASDVAYGPQADETEYKIADGEMDFSSITDKPQSDMEKSKEAIKNLKFTPGLIAQVLEDMKNNPEKYTNLKALLPNYFNKPIDTEPDSNTHQAPLDPTAPSKVPDNRDGAKQVPSDSLEPEHVPDSDRDGTKQVPSDSPEPKQVPDFENDIKQLLDDILKPTRVPDSEDDDTKQVLDDILKPNHDIKEPNPDIPPGYGLFKMEDTVTNKSELPSDSAELNMASVESYKKEESLLGAFLAALEQMQKDTEPVDKKII